MNLDELERLADDAISYAQDNPDCDDGIRKRLDYLADSANPRTIKELIELVRQCKEALDEGCGFIGSYPQGGAAYKAREKCINALAAIEKWEGK